MDNVLLKVLWVDDLPQNMFINNAYKNGVDIENVICVNEGIEKLKIKQRCGMLSF